MEQSTEGKWLKAQDGDKRETKMMKTPIQKINCLFKLFLLFLEEMKLNVEQNMIMKGGYYFQTCFSLLNVFFFFFL